MSKITYIIMSGHIGHSASCCYITDEYSDAVETSHLLMKRFLTNHNNAQRNDIRDGLLSEVDAHRIDFHKDPEIDLWSTSPSQEEYSLYFEIKKFIQGWPA